MDRPSFGTASQSRNGLRIEQIDKTISEAYKRLQKVTIENKSFEDMFKIYDNENTFFYLDPRSEEHTSELQSLRDIE